MKKLLMRGFPVVLLTAVLVNVSVGLPFHPSRGGAVFAYRGGGGASHNSTNEPKASSKPRKKAQQTSKKQSKSKSNTKNNNPVVDEVLKEEDFYTVLGITKEQVRTASNPDKEVQKAYRKRAIHTHPDKTGGDRAAFDKVTEAYEGLQDEEKRTMYNRFGKEGMKQYQQGGGGGGGAGMGSPEDLFRRFFGGKNPFDSFGQQQQQQGPAVYLYDVSLEALYHGLSRQILLPDGTQVKVTVPPGANENDVITEEIENGKKVCFRLRMNQHKHFVRKGSDLAVELRITLSESLTGLQRRIHHLNGKTLHIVSAAQQGKDNNAPAPIRSGDVHVLKGYGMPKDESSSEFGDLYIQYEVVTNPKATNSLTEEERRELKRLLNKIEGKDKNGPDWPYADHKNANVLKKSSASAFGAGYQERHNNPFSDHFNPFGNGFFFSSQSGF